MTSSPAPIPAPSLALLTHTPWRNRFADELAEGTFYTRQAAESLPNPTLLHWNPEVARLLGWPEIVAQASEPWWAQAFAGIAPLEGSDPLAAVYAGHQFGHYVPQLGDGRALLLGEVEAPDGRNWEIQLKGAGRTPYSRMGDGRAVLRSSIREYLASEAMAGLGIPTTRALCLVTSTQPVYRETVETAAVLTRVAPSFIRFGSFEYFYYKGDHEALGQLVDFTIRHYFPELSALPNAERIEAFLGSVVHSTAALIAQWQAVGFAHGVLNTDNLSILGLTLDYGPFGMMEAFDPGYVCNHSDDWGRYAFNQQPAIGYWNLTRLAIALSPLLTEPARERALSQYGPTLTLQLHTRMLAKLGLSPGDSAEDTRLIQGLFRWMARVKVDYTRCFRDLSGFDPSLAPNEGSNTTLLISLGSGLLEEPWFADYRARLNAEALPTEHRRAAMNRVNPRFIPRNYLAHQAIEETRSQGSTGMLNRLLTVLKTPFDDHPGCEDLAAEPPDWGRHLSISCSS